LRRHVGSREAFTKAIFWRLFISIPVSFVLVFLFFGSLYKSIKFTIIANITMTVLHYIYELFWDKIWMRIEKKNL
tara:strand:- start:2493 stop:2717 length:225 start_codon:yes stop_codon:yes gene_type:complete